MDKRMTIVPNSFYAKEQERKNVLSACTNIGKG